MKATHKRLLIVFAVGTLIALAGCANEGGDTNQGNNLAEETNQNISADIGESYYYEIGVTEANQQHLVRERPPFQMDDSLERQNLIRRYEYLNDRDNEHHVYLMSETGQVIAYSVAQGKVSSVNSKLTNDNQIVRAKGCGWDHSGGGSSEGPCYKTVESPQMDGSYGTNGNAIFWFTPGGHYMEWNGLYVVSEQPKNVQSQPVLVDSPNDTGNVTG